jgi:hypothetical protein
MMSFPLFNHLSSFHEIWVSSCIIQIDTKALLSKSPLAVIETWWTGEITRWKSKEHHRLSYRDILMWRYFEASAQIKILWSEKQKVLQPCEYILYFRFASCNQCATGTRKANVYVEIDHKRTYILCGKYCFYVGIQKHSDGINVLCGSKKIQNIPCLYWSNFVARKIHEWRLWIYWWWWWWYQ